jgi:hypothetical protein
VRVDRHGLGAQVRPGWDVRIKRQTPAAGGGTANALLHAATFPLPAERGDFGSGAVDLMGPDDVFVSLFEYDGEATGQPLFASQGLPVPRPRDFSPTALQRALPGQSGAQWFFSHGGRALCLFVVLGSHARRTALAPRVAQLVAGLAVSRRR